MITKPDEMDKLYIEAKADNGQSNTKRKIRTPILTMTYQQHMKTWGPHQNLKQTENGNEYSSSLQYQLIQNSIFVKKTTSRRRVQQPMVEENYKR